MSEKDDKDVFDFIFDMLFAFGVPYLSYQLAMSNGMAHGDSIVLACIVGIFYLHSG